MPALLARYFNSQSGAASSEYALMLIVLGGCVATALHALSSR
ncbi:MAG TPA: hypothetical protein VGN38_04220 [Caulobacteraceae bacterium]|jgi:Flp pilus assembly pilin Flp|nr:hypothetical protein [Caulobacteraceae bacterium]